MKKESKPLTYEAAQTELEAILQDLQNERTDIEALAEKVRRAAELVEFCKTRLRSTEAEINNLLKKEVA